MFSSRTLQVSATFASATALLCLSIGVGKISGGESAKAAASAPTMSAARIAAHVKFLASDLLEGRGTGQRGGDIAAEYIGTQFAAYGLQPAGDDGTYYQSVPMVSVKTLPSTSFKLVPKSGDAIELKNLDDFVTNSESQDESAEIDAPIVFIGYGIAAPEYKWDHYKGVDLKGKVALVFVNEPSSDDQFPGESETEHRTEVLKGSYRLCRIADDDRGGRAGARPNRDGGAKEGRSGRVKFVLLQSETPSHYRFLRLGFRACGGFARALFLLPDSCADFFGDRLPAFAFFSMRSFQAVRRAPSITSSVAAARRMWVAPPRPQPPGIGRKISGSSSTKADCCSGVIMMLP
jgi:hypothetical protein